MPTITIKKKPPLDWPYSLVRLILAALAIAYVATIARDPGAWHYVNGADLLVHETGHYLLQSFGNFFVYIAGGTIFQLLIPFIFVIYFLLQGQGYSMWFCCLWLGENFFNVSNYAGDAVTMRLNLISGGNDPIHDWHYMLTQLNLLDKTALISQTIWWIGFIIMLAGAIGTIWCSFKPKNKPYS